MASGDVVLKCGLYPLEIADGVSIQVTYSRVFNRESGLFTPSESSQYRAAWSQLTISPALPGHKWCSDCDEWRPLSYFGDDDRRSDGKRVYCKQCESERNRRRYLATRPEGARRYARRTAAHLRGRQAA